MMVVTEVARISVQPLYFMNHTPTRPVGWGGSRGSNEPPKIFEVGIFGELKR